MSKVSDVRHLEWQPQKGVNTVGMLLAHLAVVDLWWLHLAPRQTPEADGDRMFKQVLGIGGDDDGFLSPRMECIPEPSPASPSSTTGR